MKFLKYIIDDIKMMDFQYFMKKHRELYETNFKKFHITLHIRKIIRILLITILLAVFFPTPITIGLLILGIVDSIKQLYLMISPLINQKYFKFFKEEKKSVKNNENSSKQEGKEISINNISKNIIYKINDKEYTKEEIESLKPEIEINNLNNNHTKKLK